MSNWDDRRYFLAVAREGSVRQAAKALGVSRSTVLRRIAGLERVLGVRLLERSIDGYQTTAAGDEMFDSAVRMEAEAIDTERRIAGRDDRVTGSIRVSVPGLLATHLLMPDLAAFARTHSGIQLEITSSYALADLSKHEADVVIRVSNDPPENLVGRRLATVVWAAYVSRDRLDATTADQLTTLRWIAPSTNPSWLSWQQEGDSTDIPLGSMIDDPLAAMVAAKAGMGMALLPCFVGDAEPSLRRMPPGRVRTPRSLWVLTHPDLRRTARIRALIECLADAVGRHRDLVEGRCMFPTA